MKPQSIPTTIIIGLALIAVFAGGLALVGGLDIQKTKPSAEEEQIKAAVDAKPVTDCFESREKYTVVSRTENVVPEYGYPNIKCSNTTSGVLWYGDPFDGTIPIGEMPIVTDETKGDFVNAVVKPREPRLTYFMGADGCETCHNGTSVPIPKDKKPRMIMMHQDIVANSLQLMHGRGAMWCLDCHSAPNRNKLIDRRGNEITFSQPQRLCGSCHGEKYIDWREGIHGKRIGEWKTGGKKRWWVCTECHNPHTVQTIRFKPINPEPPPPLPRGMKKVDFEHSG